VATAATKAQSATTTPPVPVGELAQFVAAQRAWVRCVRDHGIAASDPDPLGHVTMPFDNKNKADPAILAKLEPCRSIQPTVPEAVAKLARPKLTPAQIEVKRRYADCMQRNGAPDFPDPDADGYFPGGNAPGDETWDPSTAGAQRATRTCAPIIGDPANPGETHG
jgi:hypothetical protein